LKKTGGHRGNAARELGMERTTLWRKMKKHGIGENG
jgi:transcriptional regulator of acetoin/glycerol metabolism